MQCVVLAGLSLKLDYESDRPCHWQRLGLRLSLLLRLQLDSELHWQWHWHVLWLCYCQWHWQCRDSPIASAATAL